MSDLAEITLTFTSESQEDIETISTWDKNTDLFLYSGPFYSNLHEKLCEVINERAKNKNLFFFLTTLGGDADVAYRIAKYLQCKFEKFTLAIFGECKSAGTLIALGANEIVMGLRGEFGPLDVQIFRPDEFLQMSSGLTISQALAFLSEKAFDTFEETFLKLRARSGGIITTKTAADIASTIAVGLYAPITEKIDPTRIGEMKRSVDVAIYYGIRLGVKEDIVEHLVNDYPSHSFVISFEEAQNIFSGVRRPNLFEEILFLNLSKILVEGYKLSPLKVPFEEGLIVHIEIIFEQEKKIKKSNREKADESANKNKKKTIGVSRNISTSSENDVEKDRQQ